MLQTERLTLRRGGEADRDDLLALNADDEVMRYISGKGFALDSPAATASLDNIVKHMTRQDGLGMWVLEWRDRPGFLGWAGLFELPGSDLIEVGYRFKKNAWGQGIATEAARCLVDYGFAKLNLDKIVAVTNVDNKASKAVLQKTGLNYQGERHFYNQTVSYFEINRSRQ